MTEAEKKIRKIYEESTPQQRAAAARESNRIEAANQKRALAAKNGKKKAKR